MFRQRQPSVSFRRSLVEPLLRALGEAPTAEQILSLKICDPAMGSGAFLVETCRFLADHLPALVRMEALAHALKNALRIPSTDDWQRS